MRLTLRTCVESPSASPEDVLHLPQGEIAEHCRDNGRSHSGRQKRGLLSPGTVSSDPGCCPASAQDETEEILAGKGTDQRESGPSSISDFRSAIALMRIEFSARGRAPFSHGDPFNRICDRI